MINMSLERPGIKTIMVIVAKHIYVAEIIHLVLIQPQRKLHRHRANQYRHLGGFGNFYVMKLFRFSEQVGAEKKLFLVAVAQFIIIFTMPRNN